MDGFTGLLEPAGPLSSGTRFMTGMSETDVLENMLGGLSQTVLAVCKEWSLEPEKWQHPSRIAYEASQVLKRNKAMEREIVALKNTATKD